MGLSTENQKRYLYREQLLTVTEIAAVTGKKRAEVYRRLSNAKKKQRKPLTDVTVIVDIPRRQGANYYTVAGEQLRVGEIVERYRLEYDNTRVKLLKGYSLRQIMATEYSKNRPFPLKGKIADKLKSCYFRAKGRYGERFPVDWRTPRAFFDAIGYPKELSDFLWVTDGEGLLSPETCYWAPKERKSEYLSSFNMGTHPKLTHHYQGQTHTVANLARKLNLPYATLLHRIRAGYPEERLGEPLNPLYRHNLMKA